MKECTATGKLLASDYDNTITAPEETVHQGNLAAIRSFREAGGTLAIVTGRGLDHWKQAEEKDGIVCDYLAVCNGMTIIRQNRVVWSAFFEEAMIRQLVGEIWDKLKYADACFLHETEEAGEDVKILASPAELNGRVTKVRFFFENQEDCREAMESVSRYPVEIYPARYAVEFEISLRGIDKGSAVKEIARLAGIERDNVFAVGDNTSDLPMLRAFHGFAVENCVEALRPFEPKIGSVSELIDKIK